MPIDRVVSLIPSATEIICALGCEGTLVARSHECDFPPSVRALPVVTAPKFDPDGTSYEIDQRVKAILQEGLSVYRVDAERLKDLRPQVIVTQAQCEVCAASVEDVERAVQDWLGDRPHIVTLSPASLVDVWGDIVRVADAVAVPEAATVLLRGLHERIEAIGAAVRNVAVRPSVACVEWLEPLMAAGNWMPELVAMAGGVSVFGRAGEHSPWLEWTELAAADPDVILVLPCGYGIEQTRRELAALTGQPGWDRLRAVREGRVFLADGNQYFNRPGPRLVESLAILAEVLHPGAVTDSHEGRGWQRLDG